MSGDREELLLDDPDAPVFHRAALEMLQRLGGEKLVSEIIGAFTAGADARLAAARAGVDSGDSGAIGRALHALKSSAGQVGAVRLQHLCGAGERLAARGSGAALTRLVLSLEVEYARARVHLDHIERNGLGAPNGESAAAVEEPR